MNIWKRKKKKLNNKNFYQGQLKNILSVLDNEAL
jgi:hypothetical protein